ncbi:MAG: hypothetical protein QM758_22265 [Armatimonas sp.]
MAWWRAGYTIEESTAAANKADSGRLLDKWAAGPLGFKDVDSYRLLHGNRTLTIGSVSVP